MQKNIKVNATSTWEATSFHKCHWRVSALARSGLQRAPSLGSPCDGHLLTNDHREKRGAQWYLHVGPREPHVTYHATECHVLRSSHVTCRRNGVGWGWPTEEGGESRGHRLEVDHRQNTRHWKSETFMFVEHCSSLFDEIISVLRGRSYGYVQLRAARVGSNRDKILYSQRFKI